MDQTTIFYGLITIVVMVIAYNYVFPSYPDLDRYFLSHQASVSSMRSPGETAVYRSLVNPIGKNLMTGLSIRGGDGKMRDGDMLDLWKLSCKARWNKAVDARGRYKLQLVDSEQWKNNVKWLAAQLEKWLDVHSPDDRTVIIALSNRFEWLIAYFAILMAAGTPVLVPIDGISREQLSESLNKVGSCILIVESELWDDKEEEEESEESAKDRVSAAPIQWLSPTIKHMIVLDGAIKMTTPNTVEVVDWDVLQKNENIPFDISESNILKARAALRYVYEDTDGKIEISSFESSHIVSAIASQIKSLPISTQWSVGDSVLSYTSRLSLHSALLSLTAMVSGSSLIFLGRTAHSDPLKVIQELSPTVVVTDDDTSYSLANSARENLTLIGNIRLVMAKVTLSKGILPKSSVFPEFSSVRLVHSSAINRNMIPQFDLTSAEANIVRALTGARFIHALGSPVSVGPIMQTGFYDYREFEEGLVSYGAPLPGLEIVLKDHKSQYWAHNRSGILYVQGCPVTGTGEWTSTGIVGQFKQGTFLAIVAAQDYV
jgi:AMP-binding enzyme